MRTTNWLRDWQTWAKEKGHGENTESYEPGELNNLLEQFYATVRKQVGKDYEPDSLRVIDTAIDRHMKERYNNSILKRQAVFRIKTTETIYGWSGKQRGSVKESKGNRNGHTISAV